MQDIINKLNTEQREAVLHTEGPLLIFAGAGSGKTRVLVNRIANLMIRHGVSPWEIMAVTFTNKAAEEMRNRVGQLVRSGSRELWISTFHAAGVKILRRHIGVLGYQTQFNIYDESDRQSIIKDCFEQLNISPKIFNPKNISARISMAKNNLIGPSQFSVDDFMDDKVLKVYELYQENLRKNNAVDLDDLLFLPVQLFRQFPQVLEQYRNQIKYFLVDEYQDTNHAQYMLIKMLAEQSQNLCVVGDDDQSIYGWRGADVRNILEFEKDFPGASVIKLEQNYRSTQTIVNAAAQVVKKIKERANKQLFTENEVGDPILCYTAKRDIEEARFVVQEIARLSREQNYVYPDFAVFYRTNAQSRVLEDELRREKIPYVIYGGMRFYDRLEIKDTLAYLTLINNSVDDLKLKRIINVPARGIGKTTLGKIEEFAFRHNISMYDALARAQELGLSRALEHLLQSFHAMIEGLKQNLVTTKLSNFTDQLLAKIGYWDMLNKEGTLEAEGRIENLKEFINVVQEFEMSQPEGGLADFLDQASLVSEVETPEDRSKALPVMTLHLAKGLEFPIVFMLGMEEGLCPHVRSLDSPAQMDEERRLVYVGMTRARKKLYLSNAESRRFFGQEQYNLPSRFLEDIPQDYVQFIKPRSEYKNITLPREGGRTVLSSTLQGIKASEFNHPYQVGVKVSHPIFGLGTIQACEGPSEKPKLTIRFQNGAIKKLMAEFANLVIL